MWGLDGILIIFCVLACVLILLRIYLRSTIVMCTCAADLSGKTAIVTGANCGIGYFTALDFAKRNARVILACRNKVKADKAKEEIIALTGNKNVVVRIVDLTLLRSVRDFAKQILSEESHLHILVNNAGVISAGKPRAVTDEGLETVFAINYFGPFLLTNLLLGLMKKSQPSRIINLSSVAHKWGVLELDNLQGEKYFISHRRYFDSKLALNLFTNELARRLEGTDVTVNAVHPGSVAATGLFDRMNIFIKIPLQWTLQLFFKTPEEGAQTNIYLAVSEEVTGVSGKYFADCSIREKETNPITRDVHLAQKLWDVSANITGCTKVE